MRRPMLLAILVCLTYAGAANATLSIAACTSDGACGVAVATHNLAVGASVSHARAGVGAVATQYETNPHYGADGLALMASGASPHDALDRLLARDGDFDGTTTADRQVGIVAANGDSAVYTGASAEASVWGGARHGRGYAIQGNGLASERVLIDMERAFLACEDAFARCLMASLRAGERAGGQTIGLLSAALLVRTPAGDWQDIDLRVDAAAAPVAELGALLDRRDAHQAILRAERAASRGDAAASQQALTEALHLAGLWDRIWRRAARLSMRTGQTDAALTQLGVFASINPVWARLELADPLYAPLQGHPLFEAWASPAP